MGRGGQAFLGAAAVGGLPVKVLRSPASGGAEDHSFPVRRPEGGGLRTRVEGRPRGNVACEIQYPDVRVDSRADGDRDPPAVGRKARVQEVPPQLGRRGLIPFVVHPEERHLQRLQTAGEIQQRPGARKAVVYEAGGGSRPHAFQNRNLAPGHREPGDVEGRPAGNACLPASTS